jgi:hypothetical protein
VILTAVLIGLEAGKVTVCTYPPGGGDATCD